jgi:lipoprotein Spr/probable lipoprotein NlpC
VVAHKGLNLGVPQNAQFLLITTPIMPYSHLSGIRGIAEEVTGHDHRCPHWLNGCESKTMISRLVIIFILSLLLCACSPYPRYRSGGGDAPMLETPPEGKTTTNDRIRFGLIIQQYLGKPYSGSSAYDPGLDCSDFVRTVFRKYNGQILPRTVADMFREGQPIARSLLDFGDLVFFKTDRHKVSHVGIYVGNHRFVHASTSRGVIISGLGEQYWAQRFVAGRRFEPDTSKSP